MSNPKSAKGEKSLEANEKLHMMYLIWVSIGCPSPDMNYVAAQLGLKERAARSRWFRLKTELSGAGLPKSRDDMPTASKRGVNEDNKGSAAKKGKRKAGNEEDETEADEHAAKKSKDADEDGSLHDF